MWLIVCLAGLGFALAAYQQQQRGGIEVAEAPQETLADRSAEAGAEAARPAEDPSADADAGSAPASRPALEEPPARGPDVGSTDAPAEGERLATLDRPREGDTGTSSELSIGTAAPRPEPEERTVPEVPEVPEASPSGAPSGVTEAPSPEQQLAATPKLPEDEPRLDLESLTTDTIRRALSALLSRSPDEPSTPPTPSEQGDGLAAVKPPVAESPSEAQMAAIEPGEEAIPKPLAPSFDLVRVQRGGQMVVAGRSAPEAEVELRAGGEVIDRVRADHRGQWVSVPLRPLPAGEQELTVAARSDEALPVESEQVVVLAVPGDAPVSAGTDRPAATAVALEASGEDGLAVLLPRDGGGEGRVLQAPGRIGSDGQLALLMLDYDDTGQIRLSGEASPGTTVRVYVDNELSGEARVGEDGAWTCALDRPLAPGSYTLRVDQLDATGQAVARLETPFTRVAQPPVQGDALVDYVIVQPGNSLWRIARRLFGDGFRYVHIYEANHGQIRDPDLIYPGQVFEIPIGIAGG